MSMQQMPHGQQRPARRRGDRPHSGNAAAFSPQEGGERVAQAYADLETPAIVAFHDRYLGGADGSAAVPEHAGPWWRWIAENHRCNTALWKEEDKARRTDVADAEIVSCKRNIDRYNQCRNDAVEALDQTLLAALGPAAEVPDVRLSSETAGAIIDRLSILALKIHHMRLQAAREEAGAAHMARCRAKLEVLIEQRGDLANCLDRLLWEARCGTARFKLYRQFKMYNDPALNPELYGRAGGGPG
ncbi:DUF4254 domain-containing protein [Azoarcus indigens]|uniref:Uncharacterized protein DUF4254 n=1 Tax=Azoarcus indigens TaxID=29545 RepID=A0A4R6DTF3_9RHOO|nr:DUF4254 domain-containing protein [Azoarcus indigens]TDN48421.1 uncharacterized protein DUF4254 [Azoarcus indigens]